MAYGIGIDIGVTNVKTVLVGEDGQVLAQEMTATNAQNADWPEGVKRHLAAVQEKQGSAATWLGLAAPGLAAPDGSCISWMMGRLEAVAGLNWTAFLQWTKPVPILNDAQAALLGEAWKGAAAGAKNAILLTLGTGVGGAILCDGRILKGHIGRAGHLGHICLDIDGDKDIVNTPGSLEEMIGNYTIEKRSGGRFKTTHDLVKAHVAGDAKASEVWLRSIRALGCGIVSLINAVDPEVVIIGGGIAAAGKALFGPLQKELDRFEWRPQGQRVKLVPAALGEFAGALGAAWNAMNEDEDCCPRIHTNLHE